MAKDAREAAFCLPEHSTFGRDIKPLPQLTQARNTGAQLPRSRLDSPGLGSWPGRLWTLLSGAHPCSPDRPVSSASLLEFLAVPSLQSRPGLPVCLTEQLGATGLDGCAEAATASRGLAFEGGPALCLCRGLLCSVWQRLPNLLLRWKHTLLLLLLRLHWEHSLGHCDCWHRVWNRVHHGGHCRNCHMHLHVHEKQPGNPRGGHQSSTHQCHLLSHGTAPLYL